MQFVYLCCRALLILPALLVAIYGYGGLEGDGGLEMVDIGLPKGTLMAVGFFTQDRNLDLFIRSPDKLSFSIFKWSGGKYREHLTMQMEHAIMNVNVNDFDHDGLLDVLVIMKISDSLYKAVLYTHFENELRLADWAVFPKMKTHPMVFDWNKDTLIDFLFVNDKGETVIMQAKPKVPNGIVTSYDILPAPPEMCKLKAPQYGAFADFDGDGMADLLLVCLDNTLEVWRQEGTEFKKSRVFETNIKGPMVVLDFDGNGAMDLLHYDPDANQLEIYRNKQVKFCRSREESESLDCKPTDKLFQFDPKFGFGKKPDVTVKVKDLFGSGSGWFGKESTIVTTDTDGEPLASLHVNDFDMDGYPDVLVVFEDGRTHKRMPAILRNTKQTFRVQEKGAKSVFLQMKGQATSAYFVPSTPSSRLPDILVNMEDGGTIMAFKNAFYRDSFFLQAEVMGSVCLKGSGKRCAELGANAERPIANGQPGATFKYRFADNDGHRHIRQGGQTMQSGYRAVPLPFMIFGLGRVSNFIEDAQTALAGPFAPWSGVLTHLIPNSKLLISPPFPDHTGWHTELYINPSDYLVYVGIASASVITLFCILTFIFKMMEIREDNQERRRALHAINFDAL